MSSNIAFGLMNCHFVSAVKTSILIIAMEHSSRRLKNVVRTSGVLCEHILDSLIASATATSKVGFELESLSHSDLFKNLDIWRKCSLSMDLADLDSARACLESLILLLSLFRVSFFTFRLQIFFRAPLKTITALGKLERLSCRA